MLHPGFSEWSHDGLRFVRPRYCQSGNLLTSWLVSFHNRPWLCSLGFAVLGKAEGNGPEWHGHVTALTVAPEYRRLGLARRMINLLELVTDETYRGYFVDL